MFGLGGTYVELFKDITHAIAPVSKKEVQDMIFGIKGHKLLTGFRGKQGVSINKIESALLSISGLITAFPEIKELDINPLNVDGSSAVALDIKIILE
jgi:acyl-CoA synthetase (NDP forming)